MPFSREFIISTTNMLIVFFFSFLPKEFPSYTKMREEREQFRKTLITLIMAKDSEDKTDDTFPNSQERQLLRYYYYIKHGIDTSHIAPMTKRMLNK